MEPEKLRDSLEWIRGHIRTSLETGFADLETLADSVVESLFDDEIDLPKRHAQVIFDEELANRVAEQQSWPPLTDCDRLDSAFDALEESGVICRQNFSCCSSCGVVEIRQVMDEERESGREVRGYAFFNEQDCANATHDNHVYLDYGSTLRGVKAAVNVGKEIVAAIRSEGLTVDWDGSIEKRIRVNLVWQRRIQISK